MFLVDKYKNSSIIPTYEIVDKLVYSLNTNNTIYNNIDNVIKLSQDKLYSIIDNMEHGSWKYANMPHLLFYGPDGCGKEFIIENLLEKIFTKKSVEVQETEYIINGYSNTKTKVMIKQSKHHIIIEPNNNGFDKYLIQEIIEEYAKSEILHVLKYKHLYKIVVINSIDNLSYYAQASLRRTMEKYADTCKFIFISNQLSKIHEPLKSRCLMVRVPLPTDNMIISIVLNISEKENIGLKSSDIINIVKYSNNNINKVFWLLELIKNKVSFEQSWTNIINIICNEILDKDNYNTNKFPDMIKQIRDMLYQLFITNIDFNIIIKELMNCLKNKLDNYNFENYNILKYNMIEETSKFENRISQGTRHIVHVEAYIIKIIQIFSKAIKINN
jgi:replication factor C subunit 3/5